MGATEGKELYDKNRKAGKPVGVIELMADPSRLRQGGHKLPCLVNRVSVAWAKPDNGAEVSVVIPRLLQAFMAKTL